MVPYICNANTGDAEAEGSQVWGHIVGFRLAWDTQQDPVYKRAWCGWKGYLIFLLESAKSLDVLSFLYENSPMKLQGSITGTRETVGLASATQKWEVIEYKWT